MSSVKQLYTFNYSILQHSFQLITFAPTTSSPKDDVTAECCPNRTIFIQLNTNRNESIYLLKKRKSNNGYQHISLRLFPDALIYWSIYI